MKIIAPNLIIGNRVQVVRYNFASKIVQQRALTQEFGPHNSVFELADVVQMPCLLQGACWKEPALQNMVRCYFWLGASVSKRFLRHYTCSIQWSQVCGARCWTYVRTKAAAFWHITWMSIITFPVLNRDDRVPL